MSMNRDVEFEAEFVKRSMAIMGRKQVMSFEQVVRQYRQIEVEFVERAGDDESRVIETKRHISQWLLMDAERTKQPHEVCRDIWEELVQRGFSVVDLKHLMGRAYARCCQWNGEFDAGLAVIEPLIAEVAQYPKDTTLTPIDPDVFGLNLEMHNEVRNELKAGVRERLMPMSRPFDPEELALTARINAVYFRELQEELSFEEAAREYRQIEAEFVERAGDDEFHAVETKRRITESLLKSARETQQPHDVCRELWEELLLRGFTNEERRNTMSRLYARCCAENGELDAGLAVLEPIITELEQRLEDTTLTPDMRRSCESALQAHHKLRDKLKAGVQ
ncbi:MAG: hypothetical protein IPM54_02575 [Polyangiaceae bacterium]|nr:hypothetical protein [Polyangiaceae bacterium]